MLRAWIFLLSAIVCEVIGVSVLNYSDNTYQTYAYGFLFFMICISYYFMSLAIRKISVGVAYAIWEVVGLSLITLISIFVFSAQLNTQQYIGLALAITGIVCVNIGEAKHDTKESVNV